MSEAEAPSPLNGSENSGDRKAPVLLKPKRGGTSVQLVSLVWVPRR